MFLNKVKFLIFVSYFILKSQALEKLDTKEDIILVTESILRNTTNNLFAELQFDKQVNPKIKQALLVHYFFTSVSLKDHNTLNLIVKLTRVNKDKVNNETEIFVKILNEILNEDENGVNAEHLTNNEDIIEYVDEFLSNLNGFKEKSNYNAYEKLDIKDEILHILKSDNPAQFHPANRNLTARKSNNRFLTENEFWAPLEETRRIYRGDRTKVRIFPFVASIEIFKNFQCAGSIIKSDLVITAASCLQLAWNNRFYRENPAFLSVRVGSNFYNGGGEEIPALEVYFHPDYDPKNLRNNIAIIRLARHLKFLKRKKRVRKIEIDKQESALPMTTDGITIIGWGAKGASNILGNPYSNQLAFAVLDVYHLQECQEIYSREYVTHKNFCAGFVSKGGGACNRDVGGPGVVNGILTGIISFGSPVCGTPDAPTVFTKVGFYVDWIEEIMEQDVPHTYKETTLSVTYPPNTPPAWHLIPTTFQLVPIPKWKPVHFYEANAARLLEDEELFKEFLETMFNSNEADELKDLLVEPPVQKSKESVTEPITAASKAPYKESLEKVIKEQLGYNTRQKLDNGDIQYESDQIEDDKFDKFTAPSYHTLLGSYNNNKSPKRDSKPKRVTVLDINLFESHEKNDDEIEKNIMEIIGNMDLDDSDDSSTSGESLEIVTETEKKLTSKAKSPVRKESRFTHLDLNLVTNEPRETTRKPIKKLTQTKKDDGLTMLYLSEDEKSKKTFDDISNFIDDFDEEFSDSFSDGLPIAAEGFEDLTFRSNASQVFEPEKLQESLPKTISLLDFLSRSDLYDLLSEAIDEVSRYKKN